MVSNTSDTLRTVLNMGIGHFSLSVWPFLGEIVERIVWRPHPALMEVNMWRIHHMDLPARKYHTWKEGNCMVDNTSYGLIIRESLHIEHLSQVYGLTWKGHGPGVLDLASKSSAEFDSWENPHPGFACPGNPHGQKSAGYRLREGKGTVCKRYTPHVFRNLPACTQ